MLSIKKNNNIKKMAIFWIIRPIKFAALKYKDIKKQTIKVDCKLSFLDSIKNYLKTKKIVGKDWEKNDNA